MTPNQEAFLDMLAYSEIGPDLLVVSDNGYDVLVGSTPKKPLLFHSYADHPHVYNVDTNSTAAGRYQLLWRWWQAYQKMLNLPDFSPTSQDAIALQQIKECAALPAIESGDLETAMAKCAHIWASLPGANYGQRENSYKDLSAAYVKAGGVLK